MTRLVDQPIPAPRRPWRRAALTLGWTVALALTLLPQPAAASGADPYDDYREAQKLVESRQYVEAEAVLRRVLEANPRERGRIRLYGMMWIDLFPHRELGVCLYHQGKIEEARREIEASILQIDSKRARQYLQKITRDGADILAAPVIDGEWPRRISQPSVALKWAPVPGAARYEIESDGFGTAPIVSEVPGATVVLPGPGTARFRVRALTPSGTPGAFSAWCDIEYAGPEPSTVTIEGDLARCLEWCRAGRFGQARAVLAGLARSDPLNAAACYWSGVCEIDGSPAGGDANGAKLPTLRRGCAVVRRALLLDDRLEAETASLPAALRTAVETCVQAPLAPKAATPP